MVDFLEYFYNSDADIYYLRDEKGNVVNEITRDIAKDTNQEGIEKCPPIRVPTNDKIKLIEIPIIMFILMPIFLISMIITLLFTKEKHASRVLSFVMY